MLKAEFLSCITDILNETDPNPYSRISKALAVV